MPPPTTRAARVAAMRVIPTDYRPDPDDLAYGPDTGTASEVREQVRLAALQFVAGRATTEAETRALRIWAQEIANEYVPWGA
ncbi:MAG: hypothetical protein EHM24_26830 [Acidobacteria bacterium]|nr:MAG: hypothetical protein EHM24_26830 [Acidobacteriota bacterium]